MAENTKRKNNSSGSRSNKTRYIYTWLWCCCHCGSQGGMSVDSTLACPDCGSYRCADCPLESVKRKVHCSDPITQSAYGSNRSSADVTALKRTKARTGSVGVEDQIQRENEPSQSSTGESSNTKGPEPAPDPQKTNLGLSQNCTANEVDTASLVAPAEDLNTVLVTTAKNCCGNESSILSEKDSQLPTKTNRKANLRQLSLDVHKATQTFACPYNKRDPFTYDPRVCKKYRTCLVPSVPVYELRRLKEHLLTTHGPLYCDKCAEIFLKESELRKHNSKSKRCQYSTGPLLYLEDGLSSTQWGDIVDLLKERGLKGPEKKSHEISIWEKIWDVLFPGLQRPVDTWVEMPSRPSSFVNSFESFIAIYKQLTAWKIEQGILAQDSNTERTHEETIRASYAICLKQISSLGVEHQLDTMPTSEHQWTEQTTSATKAWNASTICSGTLDCSQTYQMHRTGSGDVTPRSEKRLKSSQQEFRPPETSPEREKGNAATNVSQNPQMWPFNSLFDPSATLLSAPLGERYRPDESMEMVDDPGLHPRTDQCFSSVSDDKVSLTTEVFGTTRSSSPLGSGYPQLLANSTAREYYFSSEDHQISVAELDELLNLKHNES